MAYVAPKKRVTPKGTFKFPKFKEPDTKFKDAGEFSVKLVLPAATAAPMLKILQPMWDEAIANGQEAYDKLPVKTRKKTDFGTNDFYSEIYDEETEEPTGDVEFNFKTLASGVSKKTGKKWVKKGVPLVDAKGSPCAASVNPWGGTQGKISYTANPYFIPGTCMAGLSLRLEGAQILELVSGGGASAASLGFGEEEGYVSDEEFGDETDTTDTDEEDDEGGDF